MAITQVNLPAVYGAVQQHKTGQMQNQLLQMQMDAAKAGQQKQGALSSLFAEQYGGTDPTSGITWDTGRQGPGAMTDKQFAGRAGAIDPDFGMRFQEHSAKMAENTRKQMEFEAPLLARAMDGVQDQDTYGRALNMAASRGVDISDMPDQYDPETVSLMVAMGQEASNLKPTSGMQEYQQAVAQGFKGTFLDYKTALAKAGKSETNVTVGGGKYGTIPTGYQLVEGPDGAQLVPIRGGPAEQEIQAEAEKKAAAEAAEAKGKKSRATTAQIVSDDIDRIFQTMDSSTLPVAGFGSWVSGVPGTPQHDVARLVDTVKANVGFDKLQAMREASPTGGALGQVSENENRLLQSVLGNLEQSQSPEQFRRNLERVQEVFLDIVHGVGERPQESESGKVADFSTMAPADLLNVDATKLDTDQLDALMKAMDDAGL
jgi:hypothetical protein